MATGTATATFVRGVRRGVDVAVDCEGLDVVVRVGSEILGIGVEVLGTGVDVLGTSVDVLVFAGMDVFVAVLATTVDVRVAVAGTFVEVAVGPLVLAETGPNWCVPPPLSTLCSL